MHNERFGVIVGFTLVCKLTVFVAHYVHNVSNQNVKIIVW